MTQEEKEYAFGRIELAILEIYELLDEETMEKIEEQIYTIQEALGELETEDADGKPLDPYHWYCGPGHLKPSIKI
jgi:hypothetical protein